MFSQIDEGAVADRWVPSTCGLCSIGCGIEIGVTGPRIVGVRGRSGHPVNDGRLGPKGLNQYIANRHPSRATRAAVRISTLGYALPGTVLAVGIFIPIAWLDNQLSEMAMQLFHMETGLLIQGTLATMLIAYMTRFLAVSYSPIDSAMQRITSSIDEAAMGLGLSGWSMLRRIHLPMLRSGIFTAATLVFVDVMKEMPITLMTRPFGWDTLAVRIFEMTSEGEWEQAALPAVALVLAGLLPLIFFMRQSEK